MCYVYDFICNKVAVTWRLESIAFSCVTIVFVVLRVGEVAESYRKVANLFIILYYIFVCQC
jgi:hypothetical protein